jgi:hypothetical protein
VPTNNEPATRTSTPPGCVCADCGHEQSTMDPCAKCRSVRVVLLSVIHNLFGDDWRNTCFPSEGTP